MRLLGVTPKSGLQTAMRLECETYMILFRRRRFGLLCATLAIALWFARAGLCEELERSAARELRINPGAQNSRSATESAIAALVRSLAEPLKAVKARNVVVLDLRGPDGHLHPVGKWFAEQVSAAIRDEFPKIKTIDRSQVSSNDEIAGTPMDAEAVFQREIHQARLTGADVAITGAGISDSTSPTNRALRILIVAALHFLFYLDWLIEHEIRLKNPFSHRILARLVSLRRT